MKHIFIVAGFIGTLVSHAQKVVDVTKSEGVSSTMFFSVGGEPYINTKFTRLVSGTPYFKDGWLKATTLSSGDVTYKPGAVKLNLLDDQILFVDGAGQEMLATVPVKKMTLTDTITGQHFSFIHSSLLPATLSPKKGWYLQLASGKSSLYQFFVKQMMEAKPYGSATTEQTIITRNEFYLSGPTGFVQIKKAKDVLPLLPDKKQELELYLKQNGMQNSSEAKQLTDLITYYNNLP